MIIRITGDEMTALRAACMERDGWRCCDCNVKTSDHLPDMHPRKAHMAHVIGRGVGGPDTLGNVQCKCGECHSVREHNPKSVRSKL